jgi:thioredoxin reductase (NADPH)
MLKSNVRRILTEAVVIAQEDREFQIDNDAVIVNAGGVLPTDFLRRVGINVEAKFGTA